ncbi:hypothetical protein ABKW28_00365 [Nocardioides sp. 31GB23]|uniref:hypothetical protein n=1 Tax=Nocardioides sp. 31GB23 TaxID=3156065 RepID=UPI0032AFC155
MSQQEEMAPLAPDGFEIALGLLTLAHTVLVLVVVVQVLRGRSRVPHGLLGVLALLLVPVAGPLLILTWQGRVERHDARSAQVDR